MSKNVISILVLTLITALFAGILFGGCGILGTTASAETDSADIYGSSAAASESSDEGTSSSSEDAAELVQGFENGIIDAEDLFSKRDLKQTPDLSDAAYYTLADNEDIIISEAGIYVISGSASEATILVEASDDAKVQIVLDGADMTNADFPCIYVRTGDKVFITTVSDSSLNVTGAFVSDGTVKTDGAIFSRSDLVLNGTAALSVNSSKHGIVSKDDLKITGGTYFITAASHGIEANDSIRIADGSLTVKAGKDGIHAENEDDDALGYIYIGGGSFSITAGDDGIHATSRLQIDDGCFEINSAEGLESTAIQINGGTMTINAGDDGINAAIKSSSVTPFVEINGGDITISMGAGDTDCVDSNGDVTINGGTINVTGNSTFDYDGTGSINGGTVYCNGQQVTALPNQQFGGMGGFPGGGWGGHGGWNGGGFPGDGLPEGDPPEGNFPKGDFPGGSGNSRPRGDRGGISGI